MSEVGTAAGAPPGEAPPGRRRARPTLILLVVLLAASAALRLWFLPAADRLDVEAPGIDNVQAALAGDEARWHGALPISWAPQAMVVRLADRLHESGGWDWLHVATGNDRLTRRGLEWARQLSVLYGVAGLLLLFLLARRAYSTAVALMAALILAFTPWHIQASAVFAPGAQVLALVLLSLWLALRALDRPTAARLGLVGLALGVAAACELSAGLIALPVVLGLMAAGPRRARRILLPLAVTLPVALATWWLLTPSFQLVAEALAAEEATEARRAAREMSSRFTVLVFGLLHPLRETVHGRLLGSLALLGALGQAFRYLFLVDPGAKRAPRLVVLAAAPLLILGIAWATPLYRGSAFVPLLGFSSLYAALMLRTIWDGLMGLVPRLGSPKAAAVAAALVAAMVVPTGWRYVHDEAVSGTIDVALEWLRQDLPKGLPRLVLVEEAALAGSASSVMEMARGLGVRVVPRLAALDEEALARADGEVFLRRELQGAEGAFYRGRIQGPVRRKVVEGNVLWQRGADLVVVPHPVEVEPAEPTPLPTERRRRVHLARVPGHRAGAPLLSLVVQLPPTAEVAPVAPRARLGDVDIELAPAGRVAGYSLFVSERLPTAQRRRDLKIETPPWMSARTGELEIMMYLWR